MPDKEKKFNKKYVLSDSTLNDFGFRLLTSGYQLQEFAKNPIGYYMHLRDKGVVVKWTELAIEGDTITAKPCINLMNERGQQTADEVESGFLNAASIGHIVVLESTTDPSMMLTGQTGPTITKWYNRECSLVDIPSNCNSLAQLFDENNNPISLASLKGRSTPFVTVHSGNASNAQIVFPTELYLKAEELNDTKNLIAALKKDYTLYAVLMTRKLGNNVVYDTDRIDPIKLSSYMAELKRMGLSGSGDYTTTQKQSAFPQGNKTETANDVNNQKSSGLPQEMYNHLLGDRISTKDAMAIMKKDYTIYAALMKLKYGDKADIDNSKVDPARLESYMTEYKRLRLGELKLMSLADLSKNNLLIELKSLDINVFNSKMKK